MGRPAVGSVVLLSSTTVGRWYHRGGSHSHSDFRVFISVALCLALVLRIPHSMRGNIRISCVPSSISVNSLTPALPVVGILRQFASMASGDLLPARCSTPSASTISSISGVSRSPFGFGSNTSLSTLHLPGYPGRRKTRYLVALAMPSRTGLSPAR